jgi:hypothetical protein
MKIEIPGPGCMGGYETEGHRPPDTPLAFPDPPRWLMSMTAKSSQLTPKTRKQRLRECWEGQPGFPG